MSVRTFLLNTAGAVVVLAGLWAFLALLFAFGPAA